MTTCHSLQELGEILGRRQADPIVSSSQAAGCDGECIGDVHKVYDVVRDIPTNTEWHPGILCKRKDGVVLFSMGTDYKGINPIYLGEYFSVEPAEYNGLVKRTGFRRRLEQVSEGLFPSLPAMGCLGDEDRQRCNSKTGFGKPRTR